MSLPPVLARMLALWNGERIDPADVYTPGCMLNGGSTFEPNEVTDEVDQLRSSFPDLRFAVEGWFAAGDRYVLRMSATGTHTGTALSSPIGKVEATGAPFSMPGIEVFEVHGDRIVDVWMAWDYGPLYAALGAEFGR